MESMDKILAAMQHVVGAIHQLAAASPNGHPTVVALANAAQNILNDLMPKPEPAPEPSEPPPAPQEADPVVATPAPVPPEMPHDQFVAPEEPAPEAEKHC